MRLASLWLGLALVAPACAHAPVASQEEDGAEADEVSTTAEPPRLTRFRSSRSLAAEAPGPSTCDALCQQYVLATNAARYPTQQGVSVQLTPLLPTTPGLVWQNGKVLMGTWAELADFPYQQGQGFALADVTWWTAVPFMQQWCQGTGLTGDALRVRIAQRLGMPPNVKNDGFVTVWVDPQTIFRPCPDPEPWDQECLVQVPMVPPYLPMPPAQAPWACSGTQAAAAFVQVRPRHLQWMCHNWRGSYTHPEPYKNYPWTVLGYTYDWGSSDHVGPSEFVSRKGTQVVFDAAVTSDVYCASSH